MWEVVTKKKDQNTQTGNNRVLIGNNRKNKKITIELRIFNTDIQLKINREKHVNTFSVLKR